MPGRFDGILGAQRGLQPVEAGGPGLALAQHPGGGRVERLGVERQEMVAPLDAAAYQPRALEIAKGAATSVTRASPAARRLRMLRRVSSARAIRVSSSSMPRH